MQTAGHRSQRYLECYPLSLLFDAYPPALGFNRGFGYGEADAAAPYGAGAGFVGAVEAVEEVREVPLVEALAGVGHLYHGLFAAVEGAQAYLAALGGVPEGVVQQYAGHLLHDGAVAHGREAVLYALGVGLALAP